jgi:hypothetical protein
VSTQTTRAQSKIHHRSTVVVFVNS